MKKRNLIIAGIVAIIVVAIALTGIFYPSVFDQGAGGTIAKVTKYHKEQMNENDVLMRSKILSDTALLKQTINGLVMFYAFSEKLSSNLDETVISLKSSDLSGNQELIYSMKELQGYSDFIKNNNSTLDKTINVLVEHYGTKTTSSSVDIEQSLEEFSNYVYQISAKDSILDLFIDNCDEYISDSEVFKEREKEIESLKTVRDNLLLDNAQLSYIIGDAAKLQVLCDKPLYNIEKLGLGNASEIRNAVIADQDKLNKICSEDQIRSMTLNSYGASSLIASTDKNLGSYVLADADKLNSVIKNTDDLKIIVLSQEKLNNIFGSNINQLNAYLAQDGLRIYVCQSDKLQAVNSQISLGDVIQAQTLSSGVVLCNKDALQSALSKQGDLNNVLKSSEMGSCATINSIDKLDRILAVDALQFNLAAIGNKDLLSCVLNQAELSNVLKNNQSLGEFMATQKLNIIVFNQGTISAFSDMSLGMSANSTLENVLSNQIGNMYANKLNSIYQDHPNLGVLAMYNANLQNADKMGVIIFGNIQNLQAVLSSFPSTLNQSLSAY